MQLALTDLFRARWSTSIHDEWTRHVLVDRPDLTAMPIGRADGVPGGRGGLVEGDEDLIPSLILPDPDDRHVLAAAIRCHAGVIVTFNLKDFPPDCLEPFGIEAVDPDVFVADLFDLAPAAVVGVARAVRSRRKRPPIEPEDDLGILPAQRLTETASLLAEYVAVI